MSSCVSNSALDLGKSILYLCVSNAGTIKACKENQNLEYVNIYQTLKQFMHLKKKYWNN